MEKVCTVRVSEVRFLKILVIEEIGRWSRKSRYEISIYSRLPFTGPWITIPDNRDAALAESHQTNEINQLFEV